MSRIAFFDTSALIKRYIPERGSDTIAALFEDDPPGVAISRLLGVEIASAFARLRVGGGLSQDEYSTSLRAFHAHVEEEYEVTALDDLVARRAEALVATMAVRSLDAIHIATAVTVAASLGDDDTLTFYTADRRQAAAAREAGLEVELLGEDEVSDPGPT